MEVKQLYDLTNNIITEVLGESAVLNEDLSNLGDLGKSLQNAEGVENFTKVLCDKIVKMDNVIDVYKGTYRELLMDSWEYGSVVERIRFEMPEASINESWNLEDGASYDPNVFYQPSISVKYYNNKETFEIDYSWTEDQLMSAMLSAASWNGFVEGLRTAANNAIEIRVEQLCQRLINILIAETIYAEFDAQSVQYALGTGVRAINLLYEYNQNFSASLTAEEAMLDPDFLRFMAYKTKVVMDRFKSPSKILNLDGAMTFTNYDRMASIMLSDFASGAEVYLQSDVYHNQLTKMSYRETVPFWQGTGTSFDFDDITNINIKTPANHTVDVDGIVGIIFDKRAAVVSNLKKKAPTQYNKKAEFYSTFNKVEFGNLIDTGFNCVVFFVA